MRDISLKGVARQYGGFTQGFSVLGAIFGGSVTETQSLHAALSSMARRDFFFDRSECTFEWRAGFQQIWTHIHINICLIAETDVLQTALDSLVTIWQPAIESAWSNRWACGRSGELACRLTFSVNLNTSIEGPGLTGLCIGHHWVFVFNGNGQTNMSTWYVLDSGNAVAHEYGHMLGLSDEYTDSDCPNRSPVATGTIMDNNSTNIPARLMVRLANNIGSNVVAISG